MAGRWVRFTDSARQAMILAQKEAEQLGHRYLGTEHLLLGLAQEDMGVAASTLAHLGLDVNALRNLIREQYPVGPTGKPIARLALSPSARGSLNRAVAEAQRQAQRLIGTEDILLCLIHYRAGTAAKLLIRLGVSPERVREWLEELTEQESPAPTVGALEAERKLEEQYRIDQVIGIGSFSTVYRARDLRYPDALRWVAIKEMVNRSTDPELQAMFTQNFRREAEILASLRHPAIPKFLDFLTFQDRMILVMEHIDGRNLEMLLNETEGYLNTQRVISWAAQLCDVLTYLHDREPPIIFRDIKPSNIIIDRQDIVRLIDFNIAKVFEFGVPSARVGTEGYSPPEQYHGASSPQGDLYALGATLHQLLTKKDPRFEAPFSFEQRRITQINPEVSSALEQVIFRALAYSPDDRFSSAEDMKEALLRASRMANARA